MPDLDVSELLSDPDFCEQVTVTRRTQAEDNNGRASVTNTTLTITAVVTAVEGDLVRQTEADYGTKGIVVHSQTPLRGVTTAGPADIVVWKNNNYIVKRPNDWSHFGAGFTASVCLLMDVTANP